MALILLIALIGFLLACVAVPASIWAALALDAGQPATLGQSWRQGMRRFGRYFRLYLLRFLISLAIFAVVGLLTAAGVAIYSVAGKGALLVLVPLGVLLVLAWLVVSVVIAFLFIWSERTALILDQGAVAALRSSAWLARRSAGDTLIFAIVMGVIASVISLAETLVAVVIAVPGIIVLVIGASSGNTVVAVIGVLWIVILAGGFLLVGAGFIGALVQVAYALACRDLCLHHGLAPAGAAPVAAAPQSGLPSLPPAPA